jgi:hypothetical protein
VHESSGRSAGTLSTRSRKEEVVAGLLPTTRLALSVTVVGITAVAPSSGILGSVAGVEEARSP